MSPFVVRAAREDDVERLVEIHAASYPDERDFVARRRQLTEGSFGSLDDLHVALEGDRRVGHAFAYRLATWIGGRRVPIGGVASVGVAPEARGRGVAGALLEAVHATMRARGDLVSTLFAFREGFYARLGYGPTSPFVSLLVAGTSLRAPAAGRAGRLVALDGSRLAEMRALHDRFARERPGRFARDERRWVRIFDDPRTHWLGVDDADSGALAGWVAFSYDMPEPHARTTLVVRELVSFDVPTRLALVEALGRQRDQVDDVRLGVALDDPLLFAFRDADGPRRGTLLLEHPMGTIAAGPMAKLLDLPGLLAARGFAADGALAFRAPGTGTHRVEVERGEVAVARVDEAAPALVADAATLASILVGGMRPSEAVALGLARAEPAVLSLAERMLEGPRFFCVDPF